MYPPIIQPDFILSFIRLGHSALDSLVMGVFSIGGGQTAMVQAMPTMWVPYSVPVPIVVPAPQQASPPNSPQGTPAGHGATMTSVTSAMEGPSPSSIPAAVNQGVVTGVAENAHADTTSVVQPAQTQAAEKNSKKTAGGDRDRKRQSRYRHFLLKRTPKSVKFRRMVLTKALKNSTTKASNQPTTEGSAWSEIQQVKELNGSGEWLEGREMRQEMDGVHHWQKRWMGMWMVCVAEKETGRNRTDDETDATKGSRCITKVRCF
jgi:hypothetical protein